MLRQAPLIARSWTRVASEHTVWTAAQLADCKHSPTCASCAAEPDSPFHRHGKGRATLLDLVAYLQRRYRYTDKGAAASPLTSTRATTAFATRWLTSAPSGSSTARLATKPPTR